MKWEQGARNTELSPGWRGGARDAHEGPRGRRAGGRRIRGRQLRGAVWGRKGQGAGWGLKPPGEGAEGGKRVGVGCGVAKRKKPRGQGPSRHSQGGGREAGWHETQGWGSISTSSKAGVTSRTRTSLATLRPTTRAGQIPWCVGVIADDLGGNREAGTVGKAEPINKSAVPLEGDWGGQL